MPDDGEVQRSLGRIEGRFEGLEERLDTQFRGMKEAVNSVGKAVSAHTSAPSSIAHPAVPHVNATNGNGARLLSRLLGLFLNKETLKAIARLVALLATLAGSNYAIHHYTNHESPPRTQGMP